MFEVIIQVIVFFTKDKRLNFQSSPLILLNSFSYEKSSVIWSRIFGCCSAFNNKSKGCCDDVVTHCLINAFILWNLVSNKFGFFLKSFLSLLEINGHIKHKYFLLHLCHISVLCLHCKMCPVVWYFLIKFRRHYKSKFKCV